MDNIADGQHCGCHVEDYDEGFSEPKGSWNWGESSPSRRISGVDLNHSSRLRNQALTSYERASGTKLLPFRISTPGAHPFPPHCPTNFRRGQGSVGPCYGCRLEGATYRGLLHMRTWVRMSGPMPGDRSRPADRARHSFEIKYFHLSMEFRFQIRFLLAFPHIMPRAGRLSRMMRLGLLKLRCALPSPPSQEPDSRRSAPFGGPEVKVKDKLIKDMFGNVTKDTIKRLLYRYYDGDVSKVPTVNNLAPPIPPVTLVESIESKGGLIFHIPSPVPDTGLWLDNPAGPHPSWLRTPLTSGTSVCGSSYVDNTIRRLLASRNGQKVVIHLKGATTGVGIFSSIRSYGTRKGDFKAV